MRIEKEAEVLFGKSCIEFSLIFVVGCGACVVNLLFGMILNDFEDLWLRSVFGFSFASENPRKSNVDIGFRF